MNKAKWLKMAKKCMTLMLVMCCLCAPAAGGWFTKDEPKIPEQSEEFKKGLTLQNEGKYDEARAIFESGAEKGDAYCINSLGIYYGEGKGGLPKDDARALELITKAANLNLPVAYRNLGSAYFTGQLYGVTKDIEKGLKYWNIAAELNNGVANYNLAIVYLKGEAGLAQDTKKGLAFLTKAVELGDPQANAVLGGLYENGDFVEQNPKTALTYYKKAKELGYTREGFDLDKKIAEMEILAQIPEQSEEYKKGKALDDTKNYEKARPIFEAGAEKGDPWCMNALGEYYRDGKGGLQKDEARAIELMSKAAEQYIPAANYNLGAVYLKGNAGKAKDTEKGLAFMMKAADLNYSLALVYLGGTYIEGWNDVSQDQKKGMALLEKAIEMNDSNASFGLAWYYLNGKYGFPKDAKKGIELTQKAAELGNAGANYALGSYYEDGTHVEKNPQIALAYYKKAKELGNTKADSKIFKLENRPDITVKPSVLVRDYEENEVAADMKYQGKTVRLSGGIGEIGKDLMDNIYITFREGKNTFRSVQCFFDNDRMKEVAALKKGSAVTVQGQVKGLLGNVLVEHCWIVDED